MKKIVIVTYIISLIFIDNICLAQEIKPDKALLKIIDQNFKDADAG